MTNERDTNGDSTRKNTYTGLGLIFGVAVGFALGGPITAGIGAGLGLVIGAAVDMQLHKA